MATTDQDLAGLVYFARRLREETYGCGTWDEPGIVAAVAEMKNWTLEVALEQILRRATDPEARTPKAILHKVSSASLPSEKPKYGGPVKAADECPLHIGQPRPPHCATCATDDVRAYTDDLPAACAGADVANPGLAQRLAAITNPPEEAANVVPE